MIAERREKLVQQIAVRGMKLDQFKARRQRPLRRVDESLHNPIDARPWLSASGTG